MRNITSVWMRFFIVLLHCDTFVYGMLCQAGQVCSLKPDVRVGGMILSANMLLMRWKPMPGLTFSLS